MEQIIDIVNENQKERRRALEQYSEELMSVRKGLKLAIDVFGLRCMLGGELKRKNIITLHHIIPTRDGGETNIKNAALLSKLKHQDFNSLEAHFPELAMDINAYLYLYRGDCFDNRVLDRINMIMALACKQNAATEMLTVLRCNENINTLIQQHKEKTYYQSNFSVTLPKNIDQTFPVLSKHFETVYAELYAYIQEHGLKDCDIEVATRINRILHLAYYQASLVDASMPIMDERIEILEEVKQDLRAETSRLMLIKNIKSH